MSVQVQQKSYEMPPHEGFTVTHFITVADTMGLSSALHWPGPKTCFTISAQKATVRSLAPA